MEIHQALWANMLSESFTFPSPIDGSIITDSIMDLILEAKEYGKVNANDFHNFWSRKSPVMCSFPKGPDDFEDGYFPEEVSLYFPGIWEVIVDLELLSSGNDGFATILEKVGVLSWGTQHRESTYQVNRLNSVRYIRQGLAGSISRYFTGYEGWSFNGDLWVPPTPAVDEQAAGSAG